MERGQLCSPPKGQREGSPEGLCSHEPAGTGKPHSGGQIPALDHQLCELEQGAEPLCFFMC